MVWYFPWNYIDSFVKNMTLPKRTWIRNIFTETCMLYFNSSANSCVPAKKVTKYEYEYFIVVCCFAVSFWRVASFSLR